VAVTSHPIGGVCPFGLATDVPVYCDVSLKNYQEVVPAAGATNAAVRISPDLMASLTNAQWVDVCQ
jgi:prolyl-tRNA editing enzyme YbaK/EbsC (Cys-tRNA(Pro) deacylase)